MVAGAAMEAVAEPRGAGRRPSGRPKITRTARWAAPECPALGLLSRAAPASRANRPAALRPARRRSPVSVGMGRWLHSLRTAARWIAAGISRRHASPRGPVSRGRTRKRPGVGSASP